MNQTYMYSSWVHKNPPSPWSLAGPTFNASARPVMDVYKTICINTGFVKATIREEAEGKWELSRNLANYGVSLLEYKKSLEMSDMLPS